MRYLLTLLGMELKTRLRSVPFLVSSVFLLAAVLLLAVALPKDGRASLRVGFLPADGPTGAQMTARLAKNDGFEMAFYRPGEEDRMERDLLTGHLHCGYLFNEREETPFTALITDASYMRPLIDEILLAAYFEAAASGMSAAFLENNGIPGGGAVSTYERLSGTGPPMLLDLREVTSGGGAERLAKAGVQPLLYAVLACAFTITALLSSLLSGGGAQRARRQLAALSGRRAATAAAPVMAGVLLNAAVLLCADAMIARLAGGAYYSLAGRLAAIAALALVSALLALAAAPLRRISGAVTLLVPPFLAASVLFSGAIVNPDLFPLGLGVLRYLSPGWYCLQMMALL